MKQWPIPGSQQRQVPQDGRQGAFWEDRGDRRHAGVDIYAPSFSDVTAIEDGEVIEVTEFTSPQKITYWNVTYSIIICTREGLIQRYAELGSACVNAGDNVKAGQVIGRVGLVLNLEKIDDTSPAYIQRLKHAGQPSMLHFEMYSQLPADTTQYLGGNYFIQEKPAGLLDPTAYLLSLA